jgi:hypothetical protein
MNARDKTMAIGKLQSASALLADAFKTAARDNTDPELVRVLIEAKKHTADAIGRLSERPKVSIVELMA